MAIRNLKVKTDDWDPLVIHILKKKLSKTTVIDYESKLIHVRELTILVAFLSYIEHRFMALLSAEGSSQKKFDKSDKRVKKDDETPLKCTYCEKPHSVYKCNEFKLKNVKERSEWVKAEKVCVICLQRHKTVECRGKYLCKTCGKKHNTLLHFESKKDTANETETALLTTNSVNDASTSEKNDVSQVQVLMSTKKTNNLLATAYVNVLDKDGKIFFF